MTSDGADAHTEDPYQRGPCRSSLQRSHITKRRDGKRQGHGNQNAMVKQTCNEEVRHRDRVQDGTKAVMPLTDTGITESRHISKHKQQPRSDKHRRTLTIGAHGSGMFDQTGGGISGGTYHRHCETKTET